MNATVGDIAGNADRIRVGIAAAREAGAELVLFPELALTGYPPEDLLLKEHFLADARAALEQLAADVEGLVAIVGFPERAEDVYNAAAVLANGSVHAIYRKVYLPNYGVFDEQRYFQTGGGGAVIDIGERRVGLTVCEDIWEPGPPASEEALAGAALIVNISASPYHAGKGAERERMFAQRARDNVACVAFCALVGGQDELVFDGHSCVLDHTGQTIARAAQFKEDLLVCDVDLQAAAAARLRDTSHRPAARRAERRAAVLPALAAPLAPRPREHAAREPRTSRSCRRRPRSTARSRSACTTTWRRTASRASCSASRAGSTRRSWPAWPSTRSGAERVSVAVMPSPYSSAATQEDARALAASLGVRTHELPIEEVMSSYRGHPAERVRGARARPHRGEPAGPHPRQPADGAVQQVRLAGARDRQQVGDVGRLHDPLWRPRGRLRGDQGRAQDARLRALPLAQRRRPRARTPIPASIIERAPSAELRHDQRDEDSLPPYELLDVILQGYIELDRSREQLIAEGLPESDVDRTIALVDHAEYKRRQAPPGIKITARAFGRDRRMPITNRYRG